MKAASDKSGVLLHGRLPQLLDSDRMTRPAGSKLKVVTSSGAQNARRLAGATSVFVLSLLGDIPEEARQLKSRAGTGARYVLLEDQTPLESIAERIAGLDIRSPRRLHVARLDRDTPGSFVSRFLTGLAMQDPDVAIMDAWIDGDELVVISPRLERLHVPARKLPGLDDATRGQLQDFEIDPEGAFIHWPGPDVHMGWEQFAQIVQPRTQLRARQQSEAFNRKYGQAIRALREQRGLTQSRIPGLAARTVRRIEKGQTRATSAALKALAEAHGMTPDVYMNQLAERTES
jgi:DNA-binding transcriptional regulator YiaG